MRDNKRRPVLISIASSNGSGKISITSKILNHEWLEDVIYILRAWIAVLFIRFFFVGTNHPSINAARVTRRVLGGEHDAPISKIISRKLLILFLADIPYSARRRENERKREWWRTEKS